MKYWPEILTHCENAIVSVEEVEKVEMQILLSNMFHDPDVYIRNLLRGKQRTKILLAHIQNALQAWERKAGKSFEGRLRRRIIRGLYFDEPRKTVAELAVQERKPRDVIGSHLQTALKQLAALLFGADGLLKTKEAMYLHTFEVIPQGLGGKTAATEEDFHANASSH